MLTNLLSLQNIHPITQKYIQTVPIYVMILIQGNTIYSPKFQNTELFYLKLCTLFRNFLVSGCHREQAKLSV